MKFLNKGNVDTSNLKDKLYELFLKEFDRRKTIDTSIKVDISMKELYPKIDIKPTIHFEKAAYQKIKDLIKASEKELAWHGIVRKEANHRYVIEDILVYPQLVTGATVESDDEHYPEWTMTIPDDKFNRMRMQGHSHVRMGVTPSGTDEHYMERMLSQVEDYYIFMIMNKQDAIWINLIDIENNCIFEKSDMNITYAVDTQEDWAEKQIKQHIKEYKHKVTSTLGRIVGFSENYNREHTLIAPGYYEDSAGNIRDKDGIVINSRHKDYSGRRY